MKTSETFARLPESATLARRFVTNAIRGAPEDVIETVALLASELATNCIRHTDAGFDVTVIREPGLVRVEAADGGSGTPVRRFPAPTDPAGRGIQIVDMLADDWGYESLEGGGKMVWFSVTVPTIERGSPAPAGRRQ